MAVAIILDQIHRKDWFSPPLFKQVTEIDKILPTINLKKNQGYNNGMWTLLHLWSKVDIEGTINYLELMKKHYKCGGCRLDLVRYCNEHPVKKDDLVNWMKLYHEHVNEISLKKLNKNVMNDFKFEYEIKENILEFKGDLYDIYIVVKIHQDN